MARLRLAEGQQNPNNLYVNIPTPQGVVKMRNDQFLNEMTYLSEDEGMAVLHQIMPMNQHLCDGATGTNTGVTVGNIVAGAAESIVPGGAEWAAIAPAVVGFLKNTIATIKGNNQNKDSPPAVQGYQYPGKDVVLKQLSDGWLTYDKGSLFWGANHPLVKRFPPLPGGNPKAGVFYAVANDEIIQAVDPTYLDALSHASGVPSTVLKPGFFANLPGVAGSGTTLPSKGVTKGVSVAVNTGTPPPTTPWYKEKWVMPVGIGLGLTAAYLMFRPRHHNS